MTSHISSESKRRIPPMLHLLESERFLSMPKEIEEKHTEKFRQYEQFFRTPKGIKAVKYEAVALMERVSEQR